MQSRENSPKLVSTVADFNEVLTAALALDKPSLQQRKSVDVVDEYGRSVVLTVTMKNRMDSLKLLIELGADVDYYDAALSSEIIDFTAFLYAGAHGMNEALVQLIEAGAKTDIYNYYGGTALIPAAEKGHIDTVKLLLEKSSVDINHINRLGWTALMEAVILNDGGIVHQQIIKLLLEHGVDSSIPDKDGVSPLQHARQKGYLAIVTLLENHIE